MAERWVKVTSGVASDRRVGVSDVVSTDTGPLPVTLTSGKHRFTFVLISNSTTGAKQWNSIVYVNVQ